MATQDDLAVEMDGMRIEVDGLKETLRRLSRAGADAEDMRELMHSTGRIISDGAVSLAPVGKTGNLRESLRAGKGKTKAVIRAGGARVPYAGVQHYGWPARNITGSMYLVRSLTANTDRALTHLEQGLRDLLRKNALL